jgi:non-ribosomal peptide synthetase component F
MTIGKTAALAAGFVGAVIVGMAIGPLVTHRGDNAPAASAQPWDLSQPSTAAPPPAVTESAAPTVPRSKVVHEARSKAVTLKADTPAPRAAVKVSASAPELGARLKPVLNRGANMTMAADGFRDAEQFATVAHAARNTKVPFMILKHRVVDEKQSLAEAIGAANPAVDAEAEARRARTEARSDVKAIATVIAN